MGQEESLFFFRPLLELGERRTAMLLFAALLLAASSRASDPKASFASFQGRRAPSSRVGLWRSCGELSVPGTGQVLCRVEGIEAARRINNNRSLAVKRRYRYVDAATGHVLTKFGRRRVRQPPAYVTVVEADLDEDGRTVVVNARVNGRAVAPSHASFTSEASRFDTYVSPDGKPPSKAKLVGFSARGPSSPSLARAQRGLKCRESYTYADDTAVYSRFGECPAWVGPGKLCALDLGLRKLDVDSAAFPDLDDDHVFDVIFKAPDSRPQEPSLQAIVRRNFDKTKKFVQNAVPDKLADKLADANERVVAASRDAWTRTKTQAANLVDAWPYRPK